MHVDDKFRTRFECDCLDSQYFLHQEENVRKGTLFKLTTLLRPKKSARVTGFRMTVVWAPEGSRLREGSTVDYGMSSLPDECLKLSAHDMAWRSGTSRLKLLTQEEAMDYLDSLDCEQKPTEKGPKRMSAINLKTAAAIVTEDTVTLKVFFNSGQGYTTLCKKALADTLEVGDKVLVEPKDAEDLETLVEKTPRVCTVKEIHEDTLVDLNADIDYKWAFQKVDMQACQRLRETQNRLEETLRQKQRQTTRTSVLAQLGISADELKLLKLLE